MSCVSRFQLVFDATGFLAVSCLGLAAGVADVEAQEPEWTIAPYVWGAGVDLDVTIRGSTLGASVPFEDIVDKLDTAFMGHVEMRRGGFGAFFDAIALKLGDRRGRPIGSGGPFSGAVTVDSDLKLQLYELGGLYRLGEPDDAPRFDLVLGVRQVDMELDLSITLPGPNATQVSGSHDVSETDLFVGARVGGMFNERWGYRARADYGGGGTDGTLNLLATVGYTFGETGLFSIDAGYRHLEIDLDGATGGGASVRSQTVFSGPIVGFIFNF